jgi:hypothetical protein
MWRRRTPVRWRLEGALGAVARTQVGEVEAVVAAAGVEAVAGVEAAAEEAAVVEAAGAEAAEVAEVVEDPAVVVEAAAAGAGLPPRVAPRVDRSQRSGSIVPRPRPRPSCPRSIPRPL